MAGTRDHAQAIYGLAEVAFDSASILVRRGDDADIVLDRPG
jgi:hypothetical protein